MYAHILSLSLAMATVNVGQPATVFNTTGRAASPVELGGDPRIQLSGKLQGDISESEWERATEVKLVGCVPGARITTLAVCIKNCEGKQEALTTKGGALTASMKKMIANLPKGTGFSLRVTVLDDKGRTWEVPDAAFVWKG